MTGAAVCSRSRSTVRLGSVIVSGNDFRAAMGLRSTWWTVGPVAPAAAGYLHPLAPTRILDTRQPGNGNVSNPNGSPFGPGESRVLTSPATTASPPTPSA